MRTLQSFKIAFFVVLLAFTSNVQAQLPDRYIGDTAIYYGSGGPKPNVLFILDNSSHMANYSGGLQPYDGGAAAEPNSGTIYPGNFIFNQVYSINNRGNYQSQFPLSNVHCGDAGTQLRTKGIYWGALRKSGAQAQRGSCDTSKNTSPEYFFYGNYLNYLASAPEVTVWGSGTVYEVGDLVNPSDDDSFVYRAAVRGTSSAPSVGEAWATDYDEFIYGGVAWVRTASYLTVIQDLFKVVAEKMVDDVKLGIMIYGTGNKGGQVWSPVVDLDEVSLLTFNTKVDALSDSALSSGTARPVNEALFDAALYFQGKDNSNDKVANNNKSDHPSPIDYYCQESHVVILTTGSSWESNQPLKKLLGNEAYIADVAKYAYDNDLRSDLPGIQRLHTHVIQLATTQDTELEKATEEDYGNGKYAWANDTAGLVAALTNILASIVRESDTVFVAPVVPANPENQTYSGSSVYLGLFKPENDRPWSGNLKKFGLKEENGDLIIVDVDDNPVFGEESTPCRGSEDKDGYPVVEAGCNLTSYWTPRTSPDGVLVNAGGSGGELVTRSIADRYIWTWIEGEQQPQKAFNTTHITASMLGLGEEDVSAPLINFVRGFNAFDDEAPTDVRPWIMGDILHSRPLVVNYNKSDPNKTYIFVGTNGGMLHAIRATDGANGGSEAWAFIPPDLLPRLKYFREWEDSWEHYWEHSYFVDGSASIYIHDANGNGIIDALADDKAILVFGLRRGGGWQDLDHSGSHGAYYALDVTDPENPTFLWKIDNSTKGFEELAQTWSQPQFAKVKVPENGSVVAKIVAFVGGGYDNVEDLRYGNTDTYPGTVAGPVRTTGPTQDFAQGQSSGTATAARAVTRGRAVYAIEMATLGSGGFDASNSGNLLWSAAATATATENININHSVPSDILVFDRNGNGFADRIYFSDMGGNVWRTKLFCDREDCKPDDWAPADWETTKIFSSNPGQTNGVNDNTTGRKLFYRLDASVINSHKTMLFFGSGDRAHPLNHQNPGSSGAVIDRLYAVIDNDANTDWPLTEGDLDLYDVTDNVLQQEQPEVDIGALRTAIRNGSGWYIRLDFNAGEKVTAAATLFNNVVYFTTYQPDPYGGDDDPCSAAGFNLGTARLYAVNAETGEAVFNFRPESIAADQHGESQALVDTLRRADRSVDIGIGMPSGVVVVMTEAGNAHLLIVVEQEGGGISQFTQEDDSWQRVRSLYWMQW